MKRRIRLLAPIALLLALSLAIGGCSAGQQLTAAEIVDKMREAMKATQTVQATADLSVTIDKADLKTLVDGLMPRASASQPSKDWTASLPDSAAATVKIWKQAPDKVRLELESSTIPGSSGSIAVYDGTKAHAYVPSRSSYYTVTPGNMDNMPDELKAIMQGMDIEAEMDKVLDATNIVVAGTEIVAGMDAYRLDITPKPDAAEKLGLPQAMQMQAGVLIKDVKASVWVDPTRWVPLKVTVEHPNMGVFTYTVTSLELNGPVDASQFVLQVPPGTKTVDLDAVRTQSGPKSVTLPEARDAASAAGWKLLEPTNGAMLVEAIRLPEQLGSGYALNYSLPGGEFSLTQGKTRFEKQLGDDFSGINGTGTGAMKEVTVRGVQAAAFSPEGANWTSLIWQEQGSGVWVAIRGNLTIEQAVEIAEGLK